MKSNSCPHSFSCLLFRHNPVHPFENDVNIEKFAVKYDTSLFLFGSNSKKHPNSLIFGRMYDYHVLDMVELQIDSFMKSKEFHVNYQKLNNPLRLLKTFKKIRIKFQGQCAVSFTTSFRIAYL